MMMTAMVMKMMTTRMAKSADGSDASIDQHNVAQPVHLRQHQDSINKKVCVRIITMRKSL